MSQGIRLAILGAGATGKAHAAAAVEIGGYKVMGAADLIPERLQHLENTYKIPTTLADAEKMVLDPQYDAVCICLPTPLHAPVAVAALKSGKHVLIDLPPAPSSKDARAIAKAADKSGKVVLYSNVRRFGAAEQSVKQAIDKGYAGTIYQARATWLRTRGVPRGTGWYADKTQSGGGVMVDLGLPMIDLLWDFINSNPVSVCAVAHHRLMQLDVEESASVLIRFESGATAELSVAWALNQPPAQVGTTVRLSGETGAIDLYTPRGPVMYRGFNEQGNSKATEMKQPKVSGYAAVMRHFKDCIHGKSQPLIGAARGVELMILVESIYKSIMTGKSLEIR